jgi:RNA polymerase sigma factor (sigma-70 family)
MEMQVTSSSDIQKTVGHLFRHEAGKMAAVLTRMLGPQFLDEVDDIVQDTLLRAMETWKIKGLPDNPTAWLHKVARNRAIDLIRAKKREQKILQDESLKENEAIESSPDLGDEREIEDSVLRMMFACCHSAIPMESQVPFILKTLGGLSVSEIAKAFLTSEETIAKRIYRAKEKIREEKIEIVPPSVFEFPSRLNSILKVLYLLFNEGYYSASPKHTIREDLCEEAMRLTFLLRKNKYTNQPPVNALLALMCFQASRFQARTDDQQSIVLLEHQDRSKWNPDLINLGKGFLEEAASGDWLTEYHVEAAIASVHALARTFQETNWKELASLYETLEQVKPGVFVSFNKAISIGYSVSPQAGIEALSNLPGFESSQYYYVALGNFYLLMEKKQLAADMFAKARLLTKSQAEAKLIDQKIKDCS